MPGADVRRSTRQWMRVGCLLRATLDELRVVRRSHSNLRTSVRLLHLSQLASTLQCMGALCDVQARRVHPFRFDIEEDGLNYST